MTKRRIIKWLAALSGLCVILIIAVALLLPRILDSQAVKRKDPGVLVSQDKWERGLSKISISRGCPDRRWSYAECRSPFDDKVSGKIQSIEVYPSIGVYSGGAWTFLGWRW